MHANQQVYKKAIQVIEDNFPTEENQNDELINAIKQLG